MCVQELHASWSGVFRAVRRVCMWHSLWWRWRRHARTNTHTLTHAPTYPHRHTQPAASHSPLAPPLTLLSEPSACCPFPAAAIVEGAGGLNTCKGRHCVGVCACACVCVCVPHRTYLIVLYQTLVRCWRPEHMQGTTLSLLHYINSCHMQFIWWYCMTYFALLRGWTYARDNMVIIVLYQNAGHI
jgi:hypothetical protein